MPIKHWPACERPRERLERVGAQALSDAELLAIILRIGTKSQSAVELARSLLHQFGGLTQLFTASKSELCEFKGLGPTKYAQLQAVAELAKRAHTPFLEPGKALSSPNEVIEYFHSQLTHLKYEVLAMAFLDCQLHLIATETLFTGSLTETAIYPRELIRRVLHHNAHAVILVHNHPSGRPEPSEADIHLTCKIQTILEHIEVKVLDHLIIGKAEDFSFARNGFLST